MKLKSLLAAVGVCLTGTLMAQPFGTMLFQNNIDYNHYSNETSFMFGEYIFAGTRFSPGNNDIHVFKLDAAGNMMWQQFIDLGSDDRALDVVEDPNSGELIIVGYTNVYGPNEFYAVKLDPAGNFIVDNVLTGFPQPESAGTNVIVSQVSGNYIVGGINADLLTVPLTSATAVIAELDQGGLNLININSFHGPNMEHSAVNDIVEIPAGYFVTGSIDFNTSSGVQGVLAITVDHGLNLMANSSFESTNSEHNGVSAVYEDWTERIYLMSNNSVIHNPQITTFDDANGALPIINQYYLELDPTYGSHNAAGFELRFSSTNPNDELVAAGLFRTDYVGTPTPGANNANMWVAEFDKNNGANVNTVVWDAPSPNFHTHGGGVFSTFQGEAPYVFEQEMLTQDLAMDGYVYVGPNEVIPGNYGLSIVSSLNAPGASPCMPNIGYNDINIGETMISVNDLNPSPNDNPPNIPSNQMQDPYKDYCPVYYKQGAEEPTELAVEAFNVSPNPFDEFVNINIPGEIQDGELTIMDALGAVVYQQGNLSGEALQMRIDLSETAPGLYFVTVRNGDQISTEKLIRH